MVNADGLNEKLLDGTNEDFRPVWSPNGKRIAFDSYRDGNHEIYVANVDGSSPIRLTNSPITIRLHAGLAMERRLFTSLGQVGSRAQGTMETQIFT